MNALDPLLIGLISIFCLVFIILLGIPIAYALGALGLLGIFLAMGEQAAFGHLVSAWYALSAQYSMAVLPLFVVIANFAKDSFGKKEASLKNLGFGDFNLLIIPGDYLSVVVISPEEDLRPLEKPIKTMIKDVEFIHKDTLLDWDGDKEAISGLSESINRLVHGEY